MAYGAPPLASAGLMCVSRRAPAHILCYAFAVLVISIVRGADYILPLGAVMSGVHAC